MQTKLKPLFFLVTLAATALLLYAATDARAQTPTKGIFNVSAFSPNVITISPKLGRPANALPMDTTHQSQLDEKHELPSDH